VPSIKDELTVPVLRSASKRQSTTIQKVVAKPADRTSELNVSIASMVYYAQAEKTKAEVLDKLARKYSPKHRRPGHETAKAKSKFGLVYT
jgi:hypothetical protein